MTGNTFHRSHGTSSTTRTALRTAAVLASVLQLAYGQPLLVSPASAVEASLKNSEALLIARERISGAESFLDEASAMGLPKLELTGRAIQLSDVTQGTFDLPFLPGSPSVSLFPVIRHSYAARLSLTQPVFMGFRISESVNGARRQVDALRAEKNRAEDDIAFETERAFWTWLEAREAVTVLEEAAVQMEEHETLVRRLQDKGLATHAEVLRVRVRRSDVTVQAVEMRSREATAMMRLNYLMGLPLDTDLEPVTQAAIPDSGMQVEPDPIERALRHRPDLQAAEARVEAGHSAVAAARAAWYPSILFAAAFDYSNPNQRILPPRDAFDGSWELGLTFRWTLWDWSTAGSQTAQASARLRQAEAGVRSMRQAIQLEVSQSARQREDARDKLASAKLALQAAEESYRVVKEQFDSGIGTSLNVTDARIDVLRAQLAVTHAEAEIAVARAQFRRSWGD